MWIFHDSIPGLSQGPREVSSWSAWPFFPSFTHSCPSDCTCLPLLPSIMITLPPANVFHLCPDYFLPLQFTYTLVFSVVLCCVCKCLLFLDLLFVCFGGWGVILLIILTVSPFCSLSSYNPPNCDCQVCFPPSASPACTPLLCMLLPHAKYALVIQSTSYLLLPACTYLRETPVGATPSPLPLPQLLFLSNWLSLSRHVHILFSFW